jgi:hypothetical protein
MIYMSANTTTKASTKKFKESFREQKRRPKFKRSGRIDNVAPMFSTKPRPKSAAPTGYMSTSSKLA